MPEDLTPDEVAEIRRMLTHAKAFEEVMQYRNAKLVLYRAVRPVVVGLASIITAGYVVWSLAKPTLAALIDAVQK